MIWSHQPVIYCVCHTRPLSIICFYIQVVFLMKQCKHFTFILWRFSLKASVYMASFDLPYSLSFLFLICFWITVKSPKVFSNFGDSAAGPWRWSHGNGEMVSFPAFSKLWTALGRSITFWGPVLPWLMLANKQTAY